MYVTLRLGFVHKNIKESMKKFYISPLVSETEMSVELGFCNSPAGLNLSLDRNQFYDAQEEE